MLASFCTRFWDVQSFIFCVGAGGSYLQGRFASGYPTCYLICKLKPYSRHIVFTVLLVIQIDNHVVYGLCCYE